MPTLRDGLLLYSAILDDNGDVVSMVGVGGVPVPVYEGFWRVLNSLGEVFLPEKSVLNSSGEAFTVENTVVNSSGTAFYPL